MSLQLFYNLNKTVLYDWAEVQLKFKTNLKKKSFYEHLSASRNRNLTKETETDLTIHTASSPGQ